MKKYLSSFILALAAIVLISLPMDADADWSKNSNGTWCYYNADGSLAVNRWIGDYYVGSNGLRMTNTWIDGYFVGEDGKYIPNFQGGWQKINGKTYYYSKSGKKRTGWATIKGHRYYFNRNGVMQTKWQEIGGATYYFKMRTGEMVTGMVIINNKIYCFDLQTGKQVFGWTTIENKTYYFDPEAGTRAKYWKTIDGKTYWFNRLGVLQKGWRTISGDKYYFDPETGVVVTGFQRIDGCYYYFENDGKMATSTSIVVNGKTYSVDSTGVCREKTASGVSDEMLFFTVFESGRAASDLTGYAQTGGDGGCACGQYQFDYRYSLLPFVKYCYSSDKTAFAEFKTYARYTDGTKLKGNTKFYRAWKKIYKRDPKLFKSYQDAFAKEQYYDAAEKYLLSYFGISIAGRPDVVKGAVFSYAIQHGSYSAALAVKNAGIKNTTSNKQFLRKLYYYRSKQYPAYSSRYKNEYRMALEYL